VRQFELFPELGITKRNLLALLRSIERPRVPSRIRMLMTPLPRITVFDPPPKRQRSKRRRHSWAR
jgi:hypothetical protein